MQMQLGFINNKNSLYWNTQCFTDQVKYATLPIAHFSPARDLAERALAAEAVTVVCVHHADLGAR